MFRRLRMLRNWGGVVDVTPDRSPIVAKTPVAGLYLIAVGAQAASRQRQAPAMFSPGPSRRTSPIRSMQPFTSNVFRDGMVIDEAAAAAVAH